MKINTNSLCKECLKIIPAEKYTIGNEVYIKKTCPQHGETIDKIAKDSRRFFDKTFSVEGKKFNPITEYKGNCGEDCGWCDKHEQHICTGLVEITDACNFNCPICYFGRKTPKHITMDEFKNRIETLLNVENGHLDILQISGGECLIHPQFCEFLEEALKYDIRRVVINTNGHALLTDEKIFNKIKSLNEKIDLYLQFDGFEDKDYEVLRGRKLAQEKQKIIEKLNEAEVKTCLAVTIYEGNLNQIPKILEYATKINHISGITFQRLTKVGSALGAEIKSVYQEDILLAMEKSGLLSYKDMVPLPCSHENCTSLGFLFCAGDKIYSLGDYIDYTKCKTPLSNRLVFDKTVLDYLKNNLCSCFVGKVLGSSFLLDKLKSFVNTDKTTYQDMKVIRLIVKNFMDLDTFDWERARKCCTAVSVGDGKIVPFCVHNILKNKYKWVNEYE